MARRWVAPPNWPAPPSPDWAPPADWQPDPAWGPAPADWQFWRSDPPSKRRVWLLVAAGFVAAGVVAGVLVSAVGSVSKSHSVRYEVTGNATSASVSVTLSDGSVSTIESGVPYRLTLPMRAGDVASLNAGAQASSNA